MLFKKLVIKLKNGQEVVIDTDTDGGLSLMSMLDGMFDSAMVDVYRELEYINDDDEIDFRFIKSKGDDIRSVSQNYVKLDEIKDYYLVEA